MMFSQFEALSAAAPESVKPAPLLQFPLRCFILKLLERQPMTSASSRARVGASGCRRIHRITHCTYFGRLSSFMRRMEACASFSGPGGFSSGRPGRCAP